jgi:hypothetical protein
MLCIDTSQKERTRDCKPPHSRVLQPLGPAPPPPGLILFSSPPPGAPSRPLFIHFRHPSAIHPTDLRGLHWQRPGCEVLNQSVRRLCRYYLGHQCYWGHREEDESPELGFHCSDHAERPVQCRTQVCCCCSVQLALRPEARMQAHLGLVVCPRHLERSSSGHPAVVAACLTRSRTLGWLVQRIPGLADRRTD